MTPVGSILFHCWPHDDAPRARRIFEQICRNGLLLTTNTTTLDTFQIDRGTGVEPMEVWQKPRICFTDIPLNLLREHGDSYGRYGIGFERKTIIEWGGLPAWYLPNHWNADSFKVVGPTLVNALHAAKDAASQFRAVAESCIANGIKMEVRYEQGSTVAAAPLAKQLDDTESALTMVLSFIKEMSPSNSENHRYLNEREWRIVSGFLLKGHSPPCGPLGPELKEVLCAARPDWREKRNSTDKNIRARFPAAPVIDSFELFNGIPGKRTVAQSMSTVLVPNEEEAKWVRDFLSAEPTLFEGNAPEIVNFPADQ